MLSTRPGVRGSAGCRLRDAPRSGMPGDSLSAGDPAVIGPIMHDLALAPQCYAPEAMDEELGRLDALAQAELVRRGKIAPIELVEAVISRIDAVNATLNAVVRRLEEAARARARGPVGDGPLAGVPFLLKAFLAELDGTRLTESTAFLRDFVSHEDSELVRRYKRAGLIFVGKTN